MGNSLVSESNSKGRHIQYTGEHRTNVCGCMSAQSCLGRPCEHSLWAYPGLSVLLGAVQGAWRLLSFLPAANSFWPLWRPDVPGVWHTWPCLHDVKCYVKYVDYGTGSCCVGVNLIRDPPWWLCFSSGDEHCLQSQVNCHRKMHIIVNGRRELRLFQNWSPSTDKRYLR